MEYKLYKGYILGPGEQQPAIGVYETNIYQSLYAAKEYTPYHTSESEWEAQLWIEAEREYDTTAWATQADVDELNGVSANVVPKYPSYIMEIVRQHLGLEPYDTSRDSEISEMSHDAVFEHVLEWEGIIGYQYTIPGWIKDIYGVELT